MTARKYGPICSFAGCGRKHNARGLCSPHGAMQRRGELLRPLQDRTGPLPKTDVERFEAKIAHADNGCIVWTGGKTVGGYGVFSVITTHGAEKRDMAHRWAYEFNRGPIPEGFDIDHLCRNRACVNPAHLEAVTRRENIRRRRRSQDALPSRPCLQRSEHLHPSRHGAPSVPDMRLRPRHRARRRQERQAPRYARIPEGCLMDISHTLEPNSDQLDSVELVGGPRTFTITSVTKNNGEQPIDVHLADFPRPWRPGKSMRRILVACWGPDASQYIGRRVRLFCDPTVVFGGQAVGGTRIAALSHIDKPKKIPLLVTRGKSAMFTVDPLPDEAPAADTITAQQTAKLTELFTATGIERGARIGYCSMVIGRDIAKPSDLTSAEAGHILGALEDMLTDPADTDAPTLDGGPA